jgi:hypothetical protein
MPQYVIERDMPGVGQLGPEELKGASQTSCSVLRDLGPTIQWVHSYVTDNKIYCARYSTPLTTIGALVHWRNRAMRVLPGSACV